MSTVEITLPDDLERFVRKQIESGIFVDAGEVLREGLRRLIADTELRHQDRLEALQQALRPGLEDIAAGRTSDRTVADFMRDAAKPQR
jgi:putative addiction module CopG family antidote